jgi:penicillin-binding protein 2
VARAGNKAAALEAARERARILIFACVVLAGVLLLRLGWFQLIQGGTYLTLSESNYVQHFVIRAPRGLITDRNGVILVENRVSLAIELHRVRGRDDERLADDLSRFLDLDRAVVAAKLEEVRGSYFGGVPEGEQVTWSRLASQYGGVVLLEDASIDQAATIEERRSRLPGVEVVVATARKYTEGDLAAHAIGYVGEVSERDLGEYQYAPGDATGRAGVERQYERDLRGYNGIEYWVFDAGGTRLRPYEGDHDRDARPGTNITLTLDAPAQRAAEEALAEFSAGAIVGLDPRSGEVLVLASHPQPDPNALSAGLASEDWNALVESPGHPLLNRAVQATYPPGSPFKLVTAAVGLKEGKTTRQSPRVTCVGSYKYGIRTFRCWKPEGHGLTNLMKGIVESCDVFFYQLGARLGVDLLMDSTANDTPFGRPTGIDLPGEVSGNVPVRAWYDRRYGRRKWSKGVVLNLAIGQGELLVTPIQAAALVCGIVNDGDVPRPHLRRKKNDLEEGTGEPKRTVATQLHYESATLRFLKEAMVNVVEAPNGTGKLARIPGIEVGGKTGTAQNPHGENHAWFLSFAPADDPKIVLAVLVENAGGGGAIAAPIAGRIMKAYLRIGDPVPPAPRSDFGEPAADETE